MKNRVLNFRRITKEERENPYAQNFVCKACKVYLELVYEKQNNYDLTLDEMVELFRYSMCKLLGFKSALLCDSKEQPKLESYTFEVVPYLRTEIFEDLDMEKFSSQYKAQLIDLSVMLLETSLRDAGYSKDRTKLIEKGSV